MMSGAGQLLLRQVPAAFAGPGYEVFGSVIRSVSSGRIVAHLQEAGGLSKLASLVGTGPLAPLKLVADGFQIVQNEQIKASIARLGVAIETVQQLGIANLLLGAAGIGVSVAGFSLLARRIDGVNATLRGIDAHLARLGSQVAALHEDVVAGDFADLRGLASLMDEGWRESATLGERRWHKVAEEAPRLVMRFEMRARRLLEGGLDALAHAEPFLDALALAGSLQTSSRMALGETAAAHAAAQDGAARLEGLTGSVGLADLVQLRLREGKPERNREAQRHARDRAVEMCRPVAMKLREREAAAATRAAPLAILKQQGMHPRDVFLAARDVTDVAVVVLKA